MESGLTRRAGRYIDPRDHRYSSRVAGAVEFFGGFLNRGWGPISPVCDGTAPRRLMSLYHLLLGWGAAVELEPISDSSRWNWGFHTVGGGVDPRELGFLFPFV